MRGNRAATRSARAAAFAIALLAPLMPPLAAPVMADAQGDELRPEQWGMDAINAPEAAESNDGGGVLVALLDSGVDDTHPDLSEGITTGESFAEGSGPGESGTPLAGIIAGRGHGQEYTGGIVGAAPGAELVSVRVASDGGPGGEVAPAALAEGVRSAVDEGAQVIALPAGAASSGSDDSVEGAVRYASRSGALVVAPAGEGPTAYPGAYEGAVAVGAVDENLALTAESPASGAALTAPGADIRAPAAGGGYTTIDGTSAAAAFVAGTAALLRAEYPQLRPGEVVDALTSGAQPGAQGEGAAGYGAGVLDARAAMEQGATATDGEPLIDEDVAESAEEDPGLPGWALWAGGAALALLLAAVAVVLWRRATADPYGLDSRAPEDDEPERPREAAQTPAGTGRSRRATPQRKRGGRRRR